MSKDTYCEHVFVCSNCGKEFIGYYDEREMVSASPCPMCDTLSGIVAKKGSDIWPYRGE